MAENSEISWTDHTHNHWEGCQKVGPGCDNCYAEARNARFGGGIAPNWGPGAPRRLTSESNRKRPLLWNRQHDEFFAKHGRRQRVFCSSLADVFDNEVPVAWRAELLDLIAKTPNLDWLLLTKRIGNVHRMVSEALVELGNVEPGVLRRWPLPNVWLGATIVNQEEADRDIPKLLATPAKVRFLSMEPLLGPVDVRPYLEDDRFRCPECRHSFNCVDETEIPRLECPSCGHDPVTEVEGRIDWVIVGGESGPGARPMHLQWVRDIVRQCRAAGVAVQVKQLGREVMDDGMSSPGEHWPTGKVRTPVPRRTDADPAFVVRLQDRKGGDMAEWPEDLRVREFPHG